MYIIVTVMVVIVVTAVVICGVVKVHSSSIFVNKGSGCDGGSNGNGPNQE